MTDALLRFMASELAALRLFDLGAHEAHRSGTVWFIVSKSNSTIVGIVHDDGRIERLQPHANAA